MQNAYLLTGGNKGDRENYLAKAVIAIERRCGSVVAKSAIFETEAWGLEDQPAYLNQALHLTTQLSAQALLTAILEIEKGLGRVRDVKYGPRTIDIDILFYGQEIIEVPGLIIPHPHIHERRFALECLNDIAPALIHPVFNKTIRFLLKECTDSLTVNKLL
jgi:2-amino-4-hydroxy-6-hydroxymethyldihydropteridine diphosphokinase